MTVLLHVRAVASSSSIDIDLPDQTTFHQGIQTVINGCHGNVLHLLFRTYKYYFRCGMVALAEQNVVNMTELSRKSKAARGQPLIEAIIRFYLVAGFHSENSFTNNSGLSISGLILNLI